MKILIQYLLILCLTGCIMGSYQIATKWDYKYYDDKFVMPIKTNLKTTGFYYYTYTKEDIDNYFKYQVHNNPDSPRSFADIDTIKDWYPRFDYLTFFLNGQVKSANGISESPKEKWGRGSYANGYFKIINDTILFSTKQASTDPEPLSKAVASNDTLFITETFYDRKSSKNRTTKRIYLHIKTDR